MSAFPMSCKEARALALGDVETQLGDHQSRDLGLDEVREHVLATIYIVQH